MATTPARHLASPAADTFKKNPRMGIVFDQVKSGTIKIKAILEGGSAHESGKLKDGDELVRIDGRAVADLTLAQATDLIMNGCQPLGPTSGLSSLAPTSKPAGKPCGIGITILDQPPHQVTYLTPEGPAARSQAIEVGDVLVAIDNELVADMDMEEIVPRVVGQEGSVAQLWLERASSEVSSHKHHEHADEIRSELNKLQALLQDGVLDHATYTAACQKCWKGCYAVRLTRGVAYTGDVNVDLLARDASRAALVPPLINLEFYRRSMNAQVLVELPRPDNSQAPIQDFKLGSPASNLTSMLGGLFAPSTPISSQPEGDRVPVEALQSAAHAQAEEEQDLPSVSHTPSHEPADPKVLVIKGNGVVTPPATPTATLSSTLSTQSTGGTQGGWNAGTGGIRRKVNATQPRTEMLADGGTASDLIPTTSERQDLLAGQDASTRSSINIGQAKGDEPRVEVVAFVGGGSKIGLGIAKSKIGGSVLVSGVAAGGTAEEAGVIKVGDELVLVDGVTVAGRDIPSICSQIAAGANLHVTLTLVAAADRSPKTPVVNMAKAFSVVVPRPNHPDPNGLLCACPVCDRMRAVVGGSGSKRRSTGSRRSSRASRANSLSLASSPSLASPSALPMPPTGEVKAEERDQEQRGEESGEGSEDEEAPWWEGIKALQAQAAGGDGDALKQKGSAMGAGLLGGLFNLFSKTTAEAKRATAEELERRRKEKVEKERQEMLAKIAMWDAAEKLPGLLSSAGVVNGQLFVSDDTDAVLEDCKYREMVDEEDAQDLLWLLTHED